MEEQVMEKCIQHWWERDESYIYFVVFVCKRCEKIFTRGRLYSSIRVRNKYSRIRVRNKLKKSLKIRKFGAKVS